MLQAKNAAVHKIFLTLQCLSRQKSANLIQHESMRMLAEPARPRLSGEAFFSAWVASLLLVASLFFATAAVAIPNGHARIAVDAYTGKVLYASGSLKRWHPASLTKMMTLYQLFDALKHRKVSLSSKIKISHRAARQPPSKLGIRAGGHISVADAINALAIKSANDIAVAVAEHLGGSERAFARKMTATARKLGMVRTAFRNASGLHHSLQVTTARDMAILSIALMRDFPEYYTYFGKKEFRFGKRRYQSHNQLLRTYKGADGIKTGYISKAGFNLAASVIRGDRRVVAVVLGGNSSAQRLRLMTWLMDTAFTRLDNPPRRRIARPLPVRVKPPPPLPRPRVLSVAVASRASGQVHVRRFDADAPVPRLPPAMLSAKEPQTLSVPAPRTASAHESSFSIQVGAFRSAGEAERRLASVIDRLPTNKPVPSVGVTRFEHRKRGTLYRARLTGYPSNASAVATCRWLRANQTDCIVVPSDS